ncbi:MAG: hypothetical protein K2X47_13095 [Bdellovibrionales bacterium]|nr:hypothetical protein [Bdellovibrionales bacterium]
MPSPQFSSSSVLIALALISNIALMGCSSSSSGPSNSNSQFRTGKVEGGRVVNLKDLGGANIADDLVASAYEIATGPGFMYAGEFLDRALQLNPKHPSGLYLKALMDWTPLAEGIMVKGIPLANSADPQQSQTQRSNEAIAQIPDGDYKRFITRAGNQIYNETQAQDFVGAVEASLLRTREQLQKLSNQSDFTAPFVTHFGAPAEKVIKECAVTKIADGVFMIKDCPWKQSIPRQVSFADVKATNLAVAGYLTFLTLLSSYHFDGSIQLSKEITARIQAGEKVTEQESIRLMRNQTRFLKLRSGHRLTDIIGFANELTLAFEEAARLQSRFCAKGRGRLNRPGYLIENGICTGAEETEVINNLDKATRGPVPMKVVGPGWVQNEDGRWSAVSPSTLLTTINILPLLKGQIADLKAFLPTGFNSCGAGTHLSDGTLGGIFPNGDFVAVARLNSPAFLNPRSACQ